MPMPRWIPFVLLLAACRPDAPPPAPDGVADDGYARVVLGRTDASPDLPPVIVGDSLRFRVTYPGGCEDHSFDLDDERRGDTLALVLRHNAHGDTCEGQVYDEMTLPLPAAVRRHDGPVVLVAPDGETFGLR